MMRWCSYCQSFLGEGPPYDAAFVSHGICPACDVRLEAGEDLRETTAEIRSLMDRMFACGESADESAIPALLVEAAGRNLPPASVLVGLLQPVLYRAGEAWRDGRMSVAAEHRLTQWCDRLFAQLPARAPPDARTDLLIFGAPGNSHTLGPRFAAEVLATRGLVTRVVVPELALSDMVREIERLAPRVVGISCALQTALPAADALIARLAALATTQPSPRFLLGGFAVRAQGDWTSALAEVAVDLDDAEAFIRAA